MLCFLTGDQEEVGSSFDFLSIDLGVETGFFDFVEDLGLGEGTAVTGLVDADTLSGCESFCFVF